MIISTQERPPSTVKVLLVEPNPLLRQGLRALIDAQPDLEVSAEATDGPGTIRCVAAQPPQLMLCDIALAGGMGGIEAVAEVRRRCPHLPIVVLTALRAHQHVRDALAAGANGYLVKDASFDEVLLAMRSALRGRTYLSPEVSGHVVRRYLDPKSTDPGSGSRFDQLTRRERSILRLIAEGHTNRDTAGILHLSPKTIEKHRASLMRKLGLRNVAELAVLALEAGFIERPAAVMRAVSGYHAEAPGLP
jgi:DNA-binding NarL/FixJ family response regulator